MSCAVHCASGPGIVLPPPKPTLQQTIRKVINHKYVDFTVIVLILLSVVLLVLEHIYWHKTKGQDDPFAVINHILTGLFAVELTLRFLAEKKKSRFFRHYFFDIIATLAPFFRTLRFLRILRLLRIFRLGKLLNRRFNSVQSWVHHSLVQHFWMIIVLVTLVIAGAVSFQLAEQQHPHLVFGKELSFSEALWWSIFTLVGGEPLTGHPATSFAGRLISLFVMVAGLITFAALTGIVAAVMINKLKTQMELGDMDLEDLENHIVICGWNRAANLLIDVLQHSEDYHERGIILVAEYADDEPDTLLDKARIPSPSSLYVIRGDFTRTDILERAGVMRASQAIILADKCKPRSDQDRDARTILAALLIEKMNPSIFTCVELLNRDNAAHIRYAGVEEILVTDEYAGTILANAQRTRGLIPVLNELFNPAVGNQFYKVEVPSLWHGKSVGTIYKILKEEFNAVLISLETGERMTGVVEVNPDSDRVLTSGDRIVVIAKKQLDLQKLAQHALST
jgi:voltage-gated potassium channel